MYIISCREIDVWGESLSIYKNICVLTDEEVAKAYVKKANNLLKVAKDFYKYIEENMTPAINKSHFNDLWRKYGHAHYIYDIVYEPINLKI